MDIATKKALRILALSALILLGSGLLVYHRGSQINLETNSADPTLWDQSPGDTWLYVGGLMMLIAGSLSLAAVRIWWGRRREMSTGVPDYLRKPGA